MIYLKIYRHLSIKFFIIVINVNLLKRLELQNKLRATRLLNVINHVFENIFFSI